MFANCTECGQECSVVTEEDGIGAYEFHGQVGFDSGVLISSDCCYADVVDDAGRPLTEDDLHD